MVVYTLVMNRVGWTLSPKQRVLVLPVIVAVGAAVVVLAIIAIIATPVANRGAQRGVAANGFIAFKEEGTDIGVGKVFSKNDVASVLGDHAKSIADADVSAVFNYNGTRGQTLTYDFTRFDGYGASVYVDLKEFKNQSVLDESHIYNSTLKTDPVGDHPAYYMHAQTLGTLREYSLMVVDNLKVYRFALSQPSDRIAISEVSALAALKRLALKSQL